MMILFAALFAVTLCHYGKFLKVRKYAHDGCLGDVIQIAYTEFDHCVPTTSPDGLNIYVRYKEGSNDDVKLDAYLFQGNCNERKVSVKEKDITTDGVTCFEGLYHYDVLEDMSETDSINADDFGAYIEMHEGQSCPGSIFRKEYYLGWGGYCDGDDDRCDERDGYSINVVCNKPDVEVLQVEKKEEAEIEAKWNRMYMIGIAILVGGFCCFLLVLVAIVVLIVVVVKKLSKPAEVKKVEKEEEKEIDPDDDDDDEIDREVENVQESEISGMSSEDLL